MYFSERSLVLATDKPHTVKEVHKFSTVYAQGLPKIRQQWDCTFQSFRKGQTVLPFGTAIE